MTQDSEDQIVSTVGNPLSYLALYNILYGWAIDQTQTLILLLQIEIKHNSTHSHYPRLKTTSQEITREYTISTIQAVSII